MINRQPAWHRWTANIMSFLVGFGLFVYLVNVFEGTMEAVASALLSTGITILLWWLILQFMNAIRPTKATGVPVGFVPKHRKQGAAPTLSAPRSAAAEAYANTMSAIEAHTNGQVLLLSGASEGVDSTAAALNLAIAATLSGRRVLLVDGDLTGSGLSQFGGSGSSPGLIELARGESSLVEASRLWYLTDRATMPVIPSGSVNGAIPSLTAMPIADAFDRVTEKADFVLIDAPEVQSNPQSAELAAHADGTVLVADKKPKAKQLAAIEANMAGLGAPVMGYVLRGKKGKDQRSLARVLLRLILVFGLLMAAYVAWTAFDLLDAWNDRDTIEFDLEAAQRTLAATPVPSGETIDESLAAVVTTAAPVARGRLETYLIAGSDARAEVSGSRADVIMLVVLPADDSPPAIVSVPRDLFLPNPCSPDRARRINANLAGCGDVTGPNVLALAVQAFTGLPVDHFVVFDFSGFEEIIDSVGGYEICLDRPVRDIEALLELPAGCTMASGAQTLAWVRSRKTQELVDGVWRTMSGVNDLTRNDRQQQVVLDMFSRMGQFRTPRELRSLVSDLSDAFTLDENISLTDAADLAFRLRAFDPSDIQTITIPVEFHVTNAGAQVLLPTSTFREVYLEAYPTSTIFDD